MVNANWDKTTGLASGTSKDLIFCTVVLILVGVEAAVARMKIARTKILAVLVGRMQDTVGVNMKNT